MLSTSTVESVNKNLTSYVIMKQLYTNETCVNNFSFLFQLVKKVKSDLGFGIIDRKAFPPASSVT